MEGRACSQEVLASAPRPLGAVGPTGLLPEVMAKWAQALPKIAGDPEWRALVERNGSIPAIRSSDETRTYAGEQFN